MNDCTNGRNKFLKQTGEGLAGNYFFTQKRRNSFSWDKKVN